jgi:hypothetical protein
MAFGRRSKGGSSAARAQRARKGHRRRKSGVLKDPQSGYKGHRSARTKRSWLP